MILIAENRFGRAEYDPNLKHVFYTFTGRINVGLAKEVCKKVISFSKDHPVNASMADLSLATGTFTGLQEFLVSSYFPVMIERGLQGHGIVLSNDIFTQFAAKSLVQKMGEFTIHTFKSAQESKEWMQEITGLRQAS
ncbi:MAG TPA: hypothetical protein DCE41_01100 [Cytophagales bacterium]|nr:hypothetical protein [Cytophagales bacterium]HAA21055.1 hypothetical protein [Cytophagales bacterium]HAP60779.1 hypothetical protein [Cytophagales bacterium]